MPKELTINHAAADALGLLPAIASEALTPEDILRHFTVYTLGRGGDARAEESARMLQRAEKVLDTARKVQKIPKKLTLIGLAQRLQRRARTAGEIRIPEVSTAAYEASRDALVNHAATIALRVVFEKASRFSGKVADMMSVAYKGALDAVESWTPHDGIQLHAWVRVITLSEINHWFTADKAQATATNKDLQDIVAEIYRILRMYRDLGWDPRFDDVMEVIKRTSSKVPSAERARKAYDLAVGGGPVSIEVLKESGQEPSVEADDVHWTVDGDFVSHTPNRIADRVWRTPDWAFLHEMHDRAPIEGVSGYLTRVLGSRPTENELQCAELALTDYFTTAGAEIEWTRRSGQLAFDPGRPETAHDATRRRRVRVDAAGTLPTLPPARVDAA